MAVIAGDANVDGLPLAIWGLDQGLQRIAASVSSNDEELLIEQGWDAIHRIVRNIKGALKEAANGIFSNAQVYNSHILVFEHETSRQ